MLLPPLLLRFVVAVAAACTVVVPIKWRLFVAFLAPSETRPSDTDSTCPQTVDTHNTAANAAVASI